MTTEKVEATISVNSENFHQKFEESIVDLSTTKESCSYDQLIAANERLKASLSKVFTVYVNKARLEQEANGNQKKRKQQHDDDEEEEQPEDDDEDDPELSDNENENQ